MTRFIDFANGALSGAEMDDAFQRLQRGVRNLAKTDKAGERLAYVLVLQSGRTVSVSGNMRPEVERAMLNSAIEATRMTAEEAARAPVEIGTRYR